MTGSAHMLSRTDGVGIITDLLERRTGQRIDAGRVWRVESALQPVLRDGGFDSIDRLADRLVGEADTQLVDRVVQALLNQETSFFRDAAVLDQAVAAVNGMEAAAVGRRMRIWCAACSTGQEPLSLAILFREREVLTGQPMPEIRATDISAAAVERTRSARYTQFEIQRGLSVRRMVHWFEPDGGEWVARPELRRDVISHRQNLIDDPLPGGRFDLILCRNVLLYLTPELRRRVLERIAGVLRPDGLLVLGAGETVIGHTDALVPSERHRGFYRRA